jgi:hypothetical protein
MRPAARVLVVVSAMNGSTAFPRSSLPRAHAGYVCSAASIAAYASPCWLSFASGRSDLAFLLYPATHVLHAVADRLLVYVFLVHVQSDIVHARHQGASGLFSDSASPLSSAWATPRAPH